MFKLRPYSKGHIEHSDGSIYMLRWSVFESKYLSIRIHDIITEDRDKGMHDHPWWFVSFLWSGTYLERRPPAKGVWEPEYDDIGPARWRKRWSLAFRRAKDRHRIEEVKGKVRTIFIHGPERNEWGFFVPGKGKVPWHEYLKEKFSVATNVIWADRDAPVQNAIPSYDFDVLVGIDVASGKDQNGVVICADDGTPKFRIVTGGSGTGIEITSITHEPMSAEEIQRMVVDWRLKQLQPGTVLDKIQDGGKINVNIGSKE